MDKKLSRFGRSVEIISTIQDWILAFIVTVVTWLVLNPNLGRVMLFWLDKYMPPNAPGPRAFLELFDWLLMTASGFQCLQFPCILAFSYLFISSVFYRKHRKVIPA